MPQLCTVCTHKKSLQIDLAIIRGDGSNRSIAKQFGVTDSAVQRHRTEHLAAKLEKAQAEASELDSVILNTELRQCFERANLLSDACHEWLKDPANSDRYTLEARSNELDVIYEKKIGVKAGQPVYKKERAQLSHLLALIELKQKDIIIQRVQSRVADPRMLILRTLDSLKGLQELLGKVTGVFKDNNQGQPLVSYNQLTVYVQQIIDQRGGRQ